MLGVELGAWGRGAGLQVGSEFDPAHGLELGAELGSRESGAGFTVSVRFGLAPAPSFVPEVERGSRWKGFSLPVGSKFSSACGSVVGAGLGPRGRGIGSAVGLELVPACGLEPGVELGLRGRGANFAVGFGLGLVCRLARFFTLACLFGIFVASRAKSTASALGLDTRVGAGAFFLPFFCRTRWWALLGSLFCLVPCLAPCLCPFLALVRPATALSGGNSSPALSKAISFGSVAAGGLPLVALEVLRASKVSMEAWCPPGATVSHTSALGGEALGCSLALPQALEGDEMTMLEGEERGGQGFNYRLKGELCFSEKWALGEVAAVADDAARHR